MSVFAGGPEPGRDYIEWLHAKVREANAARDTYGRTHDDDCWTVHLECAVAKVQWLRGRLVEEYEAGVVAGKALAGMGERHDGGSCPVCRARPGAGR